MQENNQESKTEIKKEKGQRTVIEMEDSKARPIGVTEWEDRNNGSELIFKILNQENFLEINPKLNLHSEEATW